MKNVYMHVRVSMTADSDVCDGLALNVKGRTSNACNKFTELRLFSIQSVILNNYAFNALWPIDVLPGSIPKLRFVHPLYIFVFPITQVIFYTVRYPE
jgi:hypothetical protein